MNAGPMLPDGLHHGPRAPISAGVNPTALSPAVCDALIPNTERGTSTLFIEGGRGPRDFHLTFEREDEGGCYAYFDGGRWRPPLRVTETVASRGGVNIAVDSHNVAHLAWGEKRADGEHVLLYRSVADGQAGPVEVVQRHADHPECAIAIDAQDRIFIGGTTDSTIGIGLHWREGGGTWKSSLAPTPTARGCWAPAVACADGGRVYLAYRNRENDSPTYWNVWQDGRWTGFRFVPGHKFQPFARSAGADAMVTANAHREMQFMRISPDGRGDYTVRTAAIGPKLGRLRGAHVGLARNADGVLFATHASVEYPDTLTKTIRPGDVMVYHVSHDDGQTWGPAQRATLDPEGQGFGNVGANGRCVMLVWPDRRGGQLHLRYRLFESA